MVSFRCEGPPVVSPSRDGPRYTRAVGLRRFLVVDDEPMFGQMLGELLRDHGADVTVAERAGEVFELVKRTRFDALITDLRMPDMNGVELLRAVHALSPGTPGILITGSTGQAELSVTDRTHILAVLPKPVPFRRLLSLLDSVSPPLN